MNQHHRMSSVCALITTYDTDSQEKSVVTISNGIAIPVAIKSMSRDPSSIVPDSWELFKL